MRQFLVNEMVLKLEKDEVKANFLKEPELTEQQNHFR